MILTNNDIDEVLNNITFSINEDGFVDVNTGIESVGGDTGQDRRAVRFFEALQLQAKRANAQKALIDGLEEDVSGQPSADKLAEGWNDCRKYIQSEFKKLEEK